MTGGGAWSCHSNVAPGEGRILAKIDTLIMS